jgi:hypothetical protein
MANTVVQPGTTPAPKSLVARLIGIVTAPSETFRAVAAHPRVFGMLLITTLGVAVLSTAPMMTEAGKEAALEQQVKQQEAWTGQTVTDEQYERMRQMSGITPYFNLVGVLIFAPVMALITAGILFAIFNAAMGGNATFKQLFAVVVHAGVISLLAQLFAGPVNVLRGSVGSVANLGALVPFMEESSAVARFLGTIDIFMVWYVLVLAIGLAVLYRRRTQPIAVTLFGIYGVIALGYALFPMLRGGGN